MWFQKCGAPSLNKIKHGHELNTCASKQLDLRTSSFTKNKKIDYPPWLRQIETPMTHLQFTNAT
jgi:hypothetical protein